MSTFDYPFLMEQLSDAGFNHCKSLLFPLLGYRYMTLEEVRKVDVCEKIYEFANRYPMKPGQKKEMSFEAYCDVIEYNIQNNLKCKNGTAAEDYRNRAIEIIKELKVEKDSLSSFDKCLTLFAIYLSLLRAVHPNYEKTVATEVFLKVEKTDAELLSSFRNYKFKTNNFLGIDTPALFKKPVVQSMRETDMIYLHNIMLYCVLMEVQGEFKRRNH